MRLAALVAWAAGLLTACSSGSTGARLSSGDGGLGNGRALGTTCDPSIAQPCEILTDACSVAVCAEGICKRVLVNAGPTCGGTPPSIDGGTADDAATEASVPSDAAASTEGGDGDAASDAGDASTVADAANDAPGDGASE